MPQKGQASVTLSEKLVDMLKPIADSNSRSLAGLVKLCIVARFGTNQERKQAEKVLGMLIK